MFFGRLLGKQSGVFFVFFSVICLVAHNHTSELVHSLSSLVIWPTNSSKCAPHLLQSHCYLLSNSITTLQQRESHERERERGEEEEGEEEGEEEEWSSRRNVGVGFRTTADTQKAGGPSGSGAESSQEALRLW